MADDTDGNGAGEPEVVGKPAKKTRSKKATAKSSPSRKSPSRKSPSRNSPSRNSSSQKPAGKVPESDSERAVRDAEAEVTRSENEMLTGDPSPAGAAESGAEGPIPHYDAQNPEPPMEGDHAMADNTAVNSQITDAVTQANVKVLGDAPAMAMGAIYQSAAHATGILFENAVAQQQASQTVHQAIVAAIATRLTDGRG